MQLDDALGRVNLLRLVATTAQDVLPLPIP